MIEADGPFQEFQPGSKARSTTALAGVVESDA